MVGVAGIVWRGDQVLLIRRANDPGAGRWSLPSGGHEMGETLHQAVAREVMEEAGIEAQFGGVTGAYDVLHRDSDGRVRYQFVIVCLEGEWRAGEPMAGDDASDAAWHTLVQAEARGLWDEVLANIRISAARRGLS